MTLVSPDHEKIMFENLKNVPTIDLNASVQSSEIAPAGGIRSKSNNKAGPISKSQHLRTKSKYSYVTHATK
jgi:hypothetical protein